MEVDDTLPALGAAVPLARFSGSGEIRAEVRPRVKERFMMPRRERETGRWALSTSRVDGMTPEEKRTFGQAWVCRSLGLTRRLKSHCELPVEAVESAGGRLLRADYDQADDYNTPPRHVNVLGWPEEEDAQIAIAQELCALVETRGHIARY